jgi:hypothetical protein
VEDAIASARDRWLLRTSTECRGKLLDQPEVNDTLGWLGLLQEGSAQAVSFSPGPGIRGERRQPPRHSRLHSDRSHSTRTLKERPLPVPYSPGSRIDKARFDDRTSSSC